MCLWPCKQPIIVLYFEFENELKVYNLGAWFLYFSFLSDALWLLGIYVSSLYVTMTSRI